LEGRPLVGAPRNGGGAKRAGLTAAFDQSTFALTLRHGIWRVTFDGAFFGDYRSEQHARESIAETQGKLASKSRIVVAAEDRPT
jgi:hypothetical protein